ncbi:MAG TPA: nucleotidyltransferase family protein [Acidiferrobacteraceae bacterium]|nr:nucleotidyltransferase family protein [Acidiferrobacteraceae bacterium]
MNAMILAAGRGERMRPLTDARPKPLLEVGGSPLIEHLIRNLARAGFVDIVINYAHLGEQFPDRLGDGAAFGVRLRYSPEPPGGLETAGGIIHALPLLDSEFVVVNGDIWTDYPFAELRQPLRGVTHAAHLVLVPNPPHHPTGDFALRGEQVYAAPPELTFAGIGRYSRALFETLGAGRRPLAAVLRPAMAADAVTGVLHSGHWFDVGTPERLAALDRFVRELKQ